ncbi:deoxyguanosinetriphosphate triphosphohydrolase [Spirochaetota bacterium]
MEKNDLKYLNKAERELLAPYAACSENSRGREHKEKHHPYRTEYQRDRERIIHSRAFRRLEYKTQVFINHEGDHYRTRLTHTIEVAQIARTIARALRLNEDLSESIALAHDLGHTPFGHAGEKELNLLLKDHGGFEHNRQSLRVVDVIENRYNNFDGLNLTWETREGIIKHTTSYDHPDVNNFHPEEQPTLEAQIIDFADEIAYNNHDLDDGISSKILDLDDVKNLKIWQMAGESLVDFVPKNNKLMISEYIRNIINLLVSDLIKTTLGNINKQGVKSYEDIKNAKVKFTAFSPEILSANNELKEFLYKNLYQHYRVSRMTIKAEKVISELFSIYTEHPGTLPHRYQKMIKKDGLILTATDYIAGMTDRYALGEHKKLTDPMIKV